MAELAFRSGVAAGDLDRPSSASVDRSRLTSDDRVCPWLVEPRSTEILAPQLSESVRSCVYMAVSAMLGAATVAPGVGATAIGRDLSEFYSAEYPRLVGALTLYCGDRELAGDLAQEAMARACRDWSKVSVLQSPQAWVYRVGMNLAHSWRRRAVAGRRAMASVPDESAAADGDSTTRLAVRSAIGRLPRRQRAALVLRYFVDLPVAEVAGLMRCSEGTVRALTSQALDGLRAALPTEIAEVAE